MPQGGSIKAKKTKVSSAGSKKKKIGRSKHSLHGQSKKDELRTKAGAAFINLIEQDLAAKLPSDQRDKLTVLKQKGPRLDPKADKHKKKQLTRGRTRGKKGARKH